LRGGIKGSINAHSASVRSLAYLSPTRACWRRVNSVQAIGFYVQLHNRTESQPAEFTKLVSNQLLKAFGERIAARDPDRQTVEIQIRVALINRFNAIGTAEVVRKA